MRMVNSNICCKDLDEVVQKVGNVIIPSKDKAYKRLEVIESSKVEPRKWYKKLINKILGIEGVPEVEKGRIIYVPINSGYEVDIEKEKFTIVNAREIILIL